KVPAIMREGPTLRPVPLHVRSRSGSGILRLPLARDTRDRPDGDRAGRDLLVVPLDESADRHVEVLAALLPLVDDLLNRLREGLVIRALRARDGEGHRPTVLVLRAHALAERLDLLRVGVRSLGSGRS